MPRYRPIRQKRYEKLRNAGFLANEAHVLSRIPEKVPYLRILVQDRKILYNKSIKKQYTLQQYRARIEKLYKKNGWSEYAIIANKRLYKLNASAIYRMLREYEDKYKDEKGSQAFKSPWIKKQRDFREFTKKFDKTFNEQQFHD